MNIMKKFTIILVLLGLQAPLYAGNNDSLFLEKVKKLIKINYLIYGIEHDYFPRWGNFDYGTMGINNSTFPDDYNLELLLDTFNFCMYPSPIKDSTFSIIENKYGLRIYSFTFYPYYICSERERIFNQTSGEERHAREERVIVGIDFVKQGIWFLSGKCYLTDYDHLILEVLNEKENDAIRSYINIRYSFLSPHKVIRKKRGIYEIYFMRQGLENVAKVEIKVIDNKHIVVTKEIGVFLRDWKVVDDKGTQEWEK